MSTIKYSAVEREGIYLEDEDYSIAKGGVACPFPYRLFECLSVAEKEGLENVISWKSHGRAFMVHDPKKFVDFVMPRFFGQTKFASFQRQLNLYGFQRFSRGEDKGSYYHICFMRGHNSFIRLINRFKVKGKRRAALPEDEPDFYASEWKNHWEPSYPPGVKQPKQRLVSGHMPVSVPETVPQSIPAIKKSVQSVRRVSIESQVRPMSFLSSSFSASSVDVSYSSMDASSSSAEMDESSRSIFPVPIVSSFSQMEPSDLEPTPFASNMDGTQPLLQLVDPMLNLYSL